jgi:hypothetical protein
VLDLVDGILEGILDGGVLDLRGRGALDRLRMGSAPHARERPAEDRREEKKHRRKRSSAAGEHPETVSRGHHGKLS